MKTYNKKNKKVGWSFKWFGQDIIPSFVEPCWVKGDTLYSGDIKIEKGSYVFYDGSEITVMDLNEFKTSYSYLTIPENILSINVESVERFEMEFLTLSVSKVKFGVTLDDIDTKNLKKYSIYQVLDSDGGGSIWQIDLVIGNKEFSYKQKF